MGENAIVLCNAIALACADCGKSAGWEEHALKRPRCGKQLCDYGADEQHCVARAMAEAKRVRVAWNGVDPGPQNPSSPELYRHEPSHV